MEKYLWRNQCSAAPPFPACLLLEKEKREKTFPPKNAGNSEFSLALKKRHSNGLGVFSALQGQKLSEKRLRANTPRIGDQLYFHVPVHLLKHSVFFIQKYVQWKAPLLHAEVNQGQAQPQLLKAALA